MEISQDSDNSEGSSSIANVYQEAEAVNPLLLPVVFSCLFGQMDIAGLKNARLVCKAWAQAGAAKLIKIGLVHVDGSHRGDNWNSFTTIMGQTCTNRFQKYTLLHMSPSQLECILNYTGQYIKVLLPKAVDHYEPSELMYKVETLRNILLACPNLKSLAMFCPEVDFASDSAKLWLPQDQKLTFKLNKLILYAVAAINSNILMELINACPQLKILNVSSFVGEGTEFPTTLLELCVRRKIKLEKMVSLKLQRVDNHAIDLFRRLKLNLSTLDLAFKSNLDPVLVEDMLTQLSGTLKSFSCDVKFRKVTVPFAFPANMTKLTRIDIRSDNNYFFVEAIKSAVKLPNLRTLLLSGFSNYKSTPSLNAHFSYGLDFGLCCRLMEVDTNTTRCPSLKTLQIPFGLTDGQVFREIATIFPNVTDLRLHNSSEDVIASVFANYSNLERLSIKMQSFTPSIDSVLTGLKTKWCTTMLQKKKFKFVDPAEVAYKRPGLKDMKHLKYFELRENVSSSNLTEVSLYHGLRCLPRALQIDLQGCQQFTEGGIEELKSALGPHCFLNINKHQTGGSHFWTRQMATNRNVKEEFTVKVKP